MCSFSFQSHERDDGKSAGHEMTVNGYDEKEYENVEDEEEDEELLISTQR
jgi:hypothetical protein